MTWKSLTRGNAVNGTQLWRHLPQANSGKFLSFEVFTDYHYGVWKLEDGTWESLIEESFPPIPEEYRPHEGEPINLRVSAQGHEFTVFINDHELTTVSDDTFSSGGVGIYLVSAEVDEAVLQVDRFSVSTEIPH
ncbi:MAG: hypothetical protein H6672_22245 [Anaerolineaceae bacterium]|nr:hypothetical protein [Anaerolineaceae bacterium]